jgi:sec-independent protein translocase protein TatA
VFGISFEELIVLLVLALILFGPDKLPEYAGKIGRLVAKLRQVSAELTQQCQQTLNPYQPPQSFRELTCPQCAQKLAADFTFCPHCGHRLKETPGPEKLAS